MSDNNIHPKELLEAEYGRRAPAFYTSLLAQIVMFGKPGGILDLGAGLGLLAELAHQWGFDITGLEGSEYAVDTSLKRNQELKMCVHDLGDPLPIENNSIANVVINQVIEHLDPVRLDRLLAECYRVIEPGGRIFIYSPSKRNIKEKSEATHVNLVLPSTLKKILETAGFRIVVQPDIGLWFFPIQRPIANSFSRQLLKFFPHDWLSGTANAIAAKNKETL